MDYAALQAAVLDRLSMSTDDPAATSVGTLINSALHELETVPAAGWPWLRNQYTATVAAASTYTFATLTGQSTSTISKILSIDVLYQSDYYQPLTFMSPTEAHATYPTSQTSMPEAWYAEGGIVYVWPTPSSSPTFRTRALIVEPDLSAVGSSPVMPAVFHSAIVEGALALYYETLQDTAKLQATQARVDRWVKRMETYGPQTGTNPRVAVRDWLI